MKYSGVNFSKWAWLILVLGVVCSPGKLLAQDDEDWQKERKATLKRIVQLLIQSASNPEADSLLTHLESRAIAKKDTQILCKVYMARINSHIDQERYVDSVLDRMQLILPAATPSEHIEYQIDRAFAASNRGDYPLQILHLDSATSLAETLGDSMPIFYTKIELSMAYQNVDKFEAGLEVARQAYNYINAVTIPAEQAYLLRTIAVCHGNLGETDSAIYYGTKAMNLYKDNNGQEGAFFTQAVIGSFHNLAGNSSVAVQMLEAASDSLFRVADSSYAMGAYNQIFVWLAEAYLSMEQPERAEEAALKSFQMAKQYNQSAEQEEALQVLVRSVLFRQPESLNHFQTLLELQDERTADQNQRAVLEFERKYQTKEAEKRVLLLEQEAAKAEIRAQNTRFIVFLILALILLSGLVAGLLILRTRIRTQKQISDLNTKALQLQINPHFFFNVLNSISNYIGQNDAKSAHLYLSRFAKLMRITLESSRENLVALESEMQFLQAYLELEQLRNDIFDIQIEYDSDLNDMLIPPLMIQPFVENAVLHAFNAPNELRGIIRLGVKRKPDFLVVEIEDNGTGMVSADSPKESSEKSSLAIKILEERLSMYGRKKGSIRFEVPQAEHPTNPGTRVILQIPLNLGQ